MNFFHKIMALMFSLIASLIMVGCSGENTSSAVSSSTNNSTPTTQSTTKNTLPSRVGQGKLSVHLTDAPAEFEAVYVTIAEVHVHRTSIEAQSEDGEWLIVATPNITYNLLELQNGITTFMGEEFIPSGNYTQLRLVLKDTPDTESNLLGNPHPEAQYIILDDDQAYVLKVPNNIVEYNHNFTLIDGGDVDMVIDFDAQKSIYPIEDEWFLSPILKVQTELQ